jgi:hypothetical protein
MALGDTGITPIQHTGAYAAFANGGKLAKPYALLEVFNSKGDLVYSRDRDEPAIRTPPRPVGKVHTTEMAVLIHLASQPDGELAALPAELFTHPLARSVRSALVSAGSVAQAVAEADPESWEARLLSRLAVSEPDGTPEEAAHSLVARAGARAMEELEAELRQADRDEAGTSITSELLNLHAWVARRVDQLREPETAEVSARALVAYLRGDEGEDQSGVDH